ncbi:hypothetical protein VTK73DRAFT_832 [Phialemonium thermophilum]|uniref:Secreted protein n=1 Tax=Phialemonium thermophilum TaxID=223376 RepID=A0ABR3VU91_9PEZI
MVRDGMSIVYLLVSRRLGFPLPVLCPRLSYTPQIRQFLYFQSSSHALNLFHEPCLAVQNRSLQVDTARFRTTLGSETSFFFVQMVRLEVID